MTTLDMFTEQETRQALPKGWRWVRLGEVCTTTSGGTPSRGVTGYYHGDIPWVKSGELEDGPIFKTEESITEEAIASSSTKVFPTGTLLIALYGATVGKLGILEMEAATNQAVCAIFVSDQIERDYLFFYLFYRRSTLLELSFGGAQPNISQEIVRAIEIPLPPVPEQRRIAAILAEQLAAVERACAAATARLQAAQALPAAYLRAVFDSDEARGWPTMALGAAGNIGAGITLGRSFEGIPTRRVSYLRVANVKDGYLDLSDVYSIDVPETDITKCRLQYGDLLLTEGGDPDKLGRGTFWEEQIPECIHQNHIFRVRFDLTRFSPRFLAAQLGSSYGKAYFLSYAKQTTGIATINQRVLGGFPLLVPSLAVQERVVKQLNNQMSGAEHARATLEAQLAAIDALPAALLRRAFNGEL